jgi:hypothetical protein
MSPYRTLIAMLVMTAAVTGHGQELRVRVPDVPAEPRLLRFDDAEAARCNHLSLDTPAQIKSERSESGLTVTILANFGCQTTAGDANVWREGDTLVLSARTILPDYPTPQCLCTRKLKFLVTEQHARRIRYHQDGQPAAIGEIAD